MKKFSGTITLAFKKSGSFIVRVNNKLWIKVESENIDPYSLVGYDVKGTITNSSSLRISGKYIQCYNTKDFLVIPQTKAPTLEEKTLLILKKTGMHSLVKKLLTKKSMRKYLINPILLYIEDLIDFPTLIGIVNRTSLYGPGLTDALIKYASEYLFEQTSCPFQKSKAPTLPTLPLFIRFLKSILFSLAGTIPSWDVESYVKQNKFVVIENNIVYPVRIYFQKKQCLDLLKPLVAYPATHYLRVEDALKENRFILITGKAGTGKTTIAKQIAEFFENKGLYVARLATTGRAAQNFGGITVHKWLNFNGKTFTLPEEIQYPPHAIIIDEASFLTWEILWYILQIEAKYFILVGDPKQLASPKQVGLLSDLLSFAAVVTLDQVHRGKNEKIYIESSKLEQTLQYLYHQYFRFLPLSSWQIICPKYEGKAGVNRINAIMSQFVPEKKAIVTKNIYQNGVLILANGTTGTIEKENKGLIDFKEKETIYTLPATHVSLCYALTVHKAQGMEYDYVVYVKDKTYPAVDSVALTRGKIKTFIVKI